MYVGNDKVCLQVLDVGLAGSVTGGLCRNPQILNQRFRINTEPAVQEASVMQGPLKAAYNEFLASPGNG